MTEVIKGFAVAVRSVVAVILLGLFEGAFLWFIARDISYISLSLLQFLWLGVGFSTASFLIGILVARFAPESWKNTVEPIVDKFFKLVQFFLLDIVMARLIPFTFGMSFLSVGVVAFRDAEWIVGFIGIAVAFAIFFVLIKKSKILVGFVHRLFIFPK